MKVDIETLEFSINSAFKSAAMNNVALDSISIGVNERSTPMVLMVEVSGSDAEGERYALAHSIKFWGEAELITEPKFAIDRDKARDELAYESEKESK